MLAIIGRCCVVNLISGFLRLISGLSVIMCAPTSNGSYNFTFINGLGGVPHLYVGITQRFFDCIISS